MSKNSLNNFAKRLKIIGSNIEKNVNDIVVKFSNNCQQTLVNSTPVDTGRAKGNWYVEINEPSLETNETGSRTIEENKAVLSSRKENQIVYISNNLDYIVALENGSSAQAPKGFVQTAINVARNSIVNDRVLKKR